MPQTDLDALVKQVRTGERDAFRHIVILCEAKVRLVLAALLPDSAQVDDLAQEVFVTAYLKLDTYRLGTDFVAWIKAIARNLGRNERRRWLRSRARQSDYRQHVRIERGLESELDALSAQLTGEALDALRECIGDLSERAEGVVRAYYFQGTTSSVIADEHDRPDSWVRLVLHRARLALADCLQRKGVIDHA